MVEKQATVVVQYHFDAVSIWLNRYDFNDVPTKFSRGRFGADVGVPRLLDLHDRMDLPATWFIPGHTINNFYNTCGRIWDQGYDIQHHGYSHAQQDAFADKEAVRDDMIKGIEAIEDLTGRAPTGYSSNRIGLFTGDTIDLLEELGFLWDSSLMGREFTPYYINKDWHSTTGSYDENKVTDILELPVSWRRDDFPHFVMGKGLHTVGAAVDDEVIFKKWKNQFDWMYGNIDDGVFNLMLHPQIISMAPLIKYLEELFDYMHSKPGVEFKEMDSAAEEYR